MKQIIVLRKDLNMSAGKAAAQACHASLGAYLKAKAKSREEWFETGQTKVIVEAEDEDQMNDLVDALLGDTEIKKYVVTIKDEGRTEIAKGSFTAIGVGPIDGDTINPYTRKLKLYK